MRLDDSKKNEGRFVSRDGSPAQAPAGGEVVIQVQLKSPVQPLTVGSAKPSNFAFTAPSAVDLSNFHSIAARHGLLRSEHSFRPRTFAPNEVASSSTEVGAELEKQKYVDLHFPADSDSASILSDLTTLPEVERAVVKPMAIPPNAIPMDPLVGASDQVAIDPATGLEHEWYVFRCQVNQAWMRATGRNVIIADIDFGFLVTHQDLAPNLDMSHAHNSVDGSTTVNAGDNTDHGTAVLGLAGASANGIGMAGIAPGATLWPIQANAGNGPALPGDAFANAIDWVTNANTGGKRLVINLEVQTGLFGNYEMLPAVNLAIRNAIAKNIVVCVAAGNGNKDAGIGDDGQPIPPTGSILVGATQYDPNNNVRAWFSNFGSRIVVSAPGDQDHDVTCSNSAANAYRNGFGGTSGATPKVSGTVALLLEINPLLTHDQVKQILVSTGTAVTSPDGKTAGVFLNGAAALQAAVAAQPSRVPVES
jgi:subtilisin family serine protease